MKKWREVKKNFGNCLKTAMDMDRKAVIVTVLEAVFLAVRDNFQVILTAYVFGVISSGKFQHKEFAKIACGLGLVFLFGLAEAFCKEKREVRTVICDQKFRMAMNMKSLDMDYQTLESPEAARLREKVQVDNNWGCGFLQVFYLLLEVMKALLGIITALLFLIPFFKSGFIRQPTIGSILLVLLISGFVLGVRKGFGIKHSFEQMNQMTKIPNYAWDFTMRIPFPYGKNIRLFGNSAVFQHSMGESMGNMTELAKKMNRNGICMGICSGLGKGISQTGAGLLLMVLVAGTYTAGIDVLYRYVGFWQNIVYNVVQLAGSLVEAAGIAGRQQSTIAYIKTKSRPLNGEQPVKAEKPQDFIFEFQNVSFRYPGAHEFALKNVSMVLRGDQKIALVGPNGSGKTTLVKLLTRLYEPTTGKIMLNGRNIREYRYQEYLDIFSVVFQDFHLLALKLGENVAGGRTYDRKCLLKCLREAGLWGQETKWKSDPDVWLYKEFDSAGINLSGGEAQKIAIARSLYKKSPFVILDEPTAALDPMAEYETFSGFDRLMEGRGVLYISHRMSACRLSNVIYVFDKGRLVASGTHEELKRQNGLYAKMWDKQAKYYFF